MATRRTTDIAGDMAESLSKLIRQEFRLATDELKSKATRAGAGGALLAVAGVLALYAGACVIGATVTLFARVLPAWLATALVGAMLAVAAGIAGMAGIDQVRRSLPLAPESTVTSLAEAAEAADAAQAD